MAYHCTARTASSLCLYKLGKLPALGDPLAHCQPLTNLQSAHSLVEYGQRPICSSCCGHNLAASLCSGWLDYKVKAWPRKRLLIPAWETWRSPGSSQYAEIPYILYNISICLGME